MVRVPRVENRWSSLCLGWSNIICGFSWNKWLGLYCVSLINIIQTIRRSYLSCSCVHWVEFLTHDRSNSGPSISRILDPRGSNSRPMKIDLGIPLILPRFGWSARSRKTVVCLRRPFSHTQMFTRVRSLIYVQVGSSRYRAGEDISGPNDYFQRFWNGHRHKRVMSLSRFLEMGDRLLAFIVFMIPLFADLNRFNYFLEMLNPCTSQWNDNPAQ